MKQFSKLVTGALTVLFVAMLFSCSNLLGNTSVRGQGKNAYITLKLSNAQSRTILPVIDNNNFTDIVLTGELLGEGYNKELGRWADVTEMQNVTIPVTAGYWNFTLTATNGGIQFCGRTEKDITTGSNSLSFTMTISDFGTGAGALDITLDFSEAENAEKVSYAMASLEYFDSEVTVINESIFPSANSVVFYADGISAGTYRARIVFYSTENGKDVEIATYRELVQIVTERTSSATRTIRSLEGDISVETASPKIKFDFSGAKAVAQLDDSSARAAYDDLDNLVKILADGSMKSIITVDEGVSLSKIQAVYKSPVSEDVFVAFEYDTYLGWDDKTGKEIRIGRLICVHSDGTMADILKVRDDTYNNHMELASTDLLSFDSSGNVYFVARDYYNSKGDYVSNPGQVIYKFGPTSDELTQMVASVEGTYYSKLQITGDGTWILVNGSRSSSYFLRAIPVNNPNNPVNIYYSSTWGSIGDDKWVYDDKSGLLCYIARDGDNQGLYIVSKNGGFKDKKFIGTNVGGSSYDWFKDFYDGNIDASEFLVKFANACPWDIDIEFRYTYSEYIPPEYDEYGNWIDGEYYINHTLKDVEALEAMKKQNGEYILSSLKSDNTYYPYVLLNYCYLKDDEETCLTSRYVNKNGYNEYFFYDFLGYNGNMATALFVKDTGIYAEFWASSTNILCIVQVADEHGNLIEKTTRIKLPEGKKIDTQKYDNQFIVKYALTDSSGSELGYHQLYSVDLDNREVINRFDNVANRNFLEVISYSVGADKLYFSAVRGTVVENHIVDLVTNQSNPLDINRKMVAVYAF